MATKEKTILTAEEVTTAERSPQEKAELEAKAKADQEAELADQRVVGEAVKKKADLDVKIDQPAKVKTEAQKMVEKYRKSYPGNAIFYVTSDMQMFLKQDYNMALLHQKTLKEGELETVKL